MKFKGLINQTVKFFSKNGDVVLTVLGCVGVPLTAYFASKDTLKCKKKLEAAGEDIAPKEKAKIIAKTYIPTACATIVTEAAIVSASVLGRHRASKYASAALLAETALRDWKDSAKEEMTPEQYSKVEKKVAEKQTISACRPVIFDPAMEFLAVEPMTGKEFRTTKAAIENAFININHMMLNQDTATLNDMLYEFGIDQVPVGDCKVWNIMRGKLTWRPVYGDCSETGIPILRIEYSREPENA